MNYKHTRMVGLTLLLLALSFGALAAAMNPGTSLEDASWGGMRLLHLTLSAAAAGASLFFLPQFTGRALGATITCGILFGTAGPPALAWLVQWYMDGKTVLPGAVLNMMAIVLGVSGVFIVAGLTKMGATFAAKPFSFIPWFKSAGTAVPADDGGKEARP